MLLGSKTQSVVSLSLADIIKKHLHQQETVNINTNQIYSRFLCSSDAFVYMHVFVHQPMKSVGDVKRGFGAPFAHWIDACQFPAVKQLAQGQAWTLSVQSLISMWTTRPSALLLQKSQTAMFSHKGHIFPKPAAGPKGQQSYVTRETFFYSLYVLLSLSCREEILGVGGRRNNDGA